MNETTVAYAAELYFYRNVLIGKPCLHVELNLGWNMYPLRWRVSKKSLRARYTIIIKFVWQLYVQPDLQTQELAEETKKVHLRVALS